MRRAKVERVIASLILVIVSFFSLRLENGIVSGSMSVQRLVGDRSWIKILSYTWSASYVVIQTLSFVFYVTLLGAFIVFPYSSFDGE